MLRLQKVIDPLPEHHYQIKGVWSVFAVQNCLSDYSRAWKITNSRSNSSIFGLYICACTSTHEFAQIQTSPLSPARQLTNPVVRHVSAFDSLPFHSRSSPIHAPLSCTKTPKQKHPLIHHLLLLVAHQYMHHSHARSQSKSHTH